jgi:thiamine pyrophosphokinase
VVFYLITMSRIIIFANGILTQPNLLKARLRPTDRIFCADGGTYHALALGLTPEVIVGDLDSLAPKVVRQMETAGVRFHRHPTDKDKTDLELALELAVAAQPQEIVLVSALGGRLDQMLANILLLTQPKYASTRLSLSEGAQWATILLSHQSLVVQGQPGDRLSLIPLSPTVHGVTLTGVKWPLADANLSFGSTLTISNTLADAQAIVQIGRGIILVIHLDPNDEEFTSSRGLHPKG